MGRAGPELVIGLVGAIGTDLDAITVGVQNALSALDYESKAINLVETLTEYSAFKDISPRAADERYRKRMDAGNKFRSLLKAEDAMALMAIAAIRNERRQANNNPDQPITRFAYISA